MRTIRTKEELEAYRAEIYFNLQFLNPGRDFEVLFGDNGGGKMGFIHIWLDGKGPLITETTGGES